MNKSDYIYNDLKKEILDGKFDKYRLLPIEVELQDKYQASRNTVRKAIRQLNYDGLIYSKEGSGNVVLERIEIPNLLIRSGDFEKPSTIAKEKVTTELLLFDKVNASKEIASSSFFQEDISLWHVVRLRFVDGLPAMIDNSYFRADLILKLSPTVSTGSIYRYIKEELCLKIIGSKLVDSVQLATDFEKKYLNLKEANCVARTQNWAYLDSGEIFEYTEISFAPNFYLRSRFMRY